MQREYLCHECGNRELGKKRIFWCLHCGSFKMKLTPESRVRLIAGWLRRLFNGHL